MIIWFPLALALLAVAFDLRSRQIPNAIPLLILAGAMISILCGWTPVSWRAAFCGMGMAFAVGLLLFRIGAWGGGDVKLLIALSAWLGPLGLLSTLVWMGVIGGILSVATVIRGGRDLAYAPAIVGGLAVHLMLPHVFQGLLGG